MKDIAIYGAGSYGRKIACLITAINKQAIIDGKKIPIGI
jgi:hypothetical protein